MLPIGCRHPLSIVSGVADAKMKGVLQRLVSTTPSTTSAAEPRRLKLNLIMPDELLSGMLTQVCL